MAGNGLCVRFTWERLQPRGRHVACEFRWVRHAAERRARRLAQLRGGAVDRPDGELRAVRQHPVRMRRARRNACVIAAREHGLPCAYGQFHSSVEHQHGFMATLMPMDRHRRTLAAGPDDAFEPVRGVFGPGDHRCQLRTDQIPLSLSIAYQIGRARARK